MISATVRRVSAVWGDEAAGTGWLALGVGTTFVFGLLLQVLGLRSLEHGAYSTFVVGLGLGNVANAICTVVQPIVAAHGDRERAAFLPVERTPALLMTAAGTVLATVALAPSVGAFEAAAGLLQIPLHVVGAAGLGRLQAARSFRKIALVLALWSVSRVAVVLPWILTGNASAAVFMAALPVAALVQLGLLSAFGAWDGLDLTAPVAQRRALLHHYAFWALFAWLLNADAILARVSLSATAADAYAIALTLGRQPAYVIAPLMMVLLPVTRGAHDGEQRGRLHAIGLVSLLVAGGTFVVLGLRPDLILTALTGTADSSSTGLVRGYALVGSLAAAASLLMTFVFGLGRAPRIAVMASLPVAQAAFTLGLVSRGSTLLFVQGAVLAALTGLLVWVALRATATRGESRVQRGPG